MPQPAKSARLQIVNGNPNKKNTNELRRRAEQEEKMQMATDKIKAPTWLDKDGKIAFDFLAKELLSVEIITNGDIYPLAMYCYWYSQHLKLQKEGSKQFNEEGNPLIKQIDTCSKNMRSFGSDLGLSPSARAKLAIKLAQDENDDDDF